jgi:glutamate-1-semialdehyde aminotransferase
MKFGKWDAYTTTDFGQHLPNVGPYAPTSGKLVPFGDIEALTECFEQDAHNLAAFIVEPVQGWAGYVSQRCHGNWSIIADIFVALLPHRLDI